MGEALTGRIEHGGAGSAVFDCLRENMPNRLKELLQQARRGRTVDLRANEPAIVSDFFFQNGNLRRAGQLFLEHIQSQGARLISRAGVAAPAKPAKPYEIALSFAGEDRSFVDGVARQLQKIGVNVFYDHFETVTLLGKDLAAHFAEIYGKEATYCAMFISKDYARKAWPQFERQHAQAPPLPVKREYILPLRLHNHDVPVLAGTIGDIDVRSMPPPTVAEILFPKIRG